METFKMALGLSPEQVAACDADATRASADADVRARFHAGVFARMGDLQPIRRRSEGDPYAVHEYRVTMARRNAAALVALHALRTTVDDALTSEQ